MTRRTLALGVAAWLVVVTVGAGLVWAVISRAGEGVASSAQPPVGGSTLELRPATEATARPPSGSRSPSGTRSTDRPPSGTASTATSSPAPAASSAPPSGGGTATVRRTWQGDAGLVIAECTGSRIRLVNAQPRTGYGVEVERGGPVELEVEFETNSGSAKTKVEGVCSGGSPVFEARAEE